ALRCYVDKRALNIHWECKGFSQRAVGIGEECSPARRIRRQRQDQVSPARSVLMGSQRIELNFGSPEQSAGESGVHQVSQIDASRLRRVEERGIVGEIALNVPGTRYCSRRLRGGAEINIHSADPDFRSAVKLPAGLNGEVGIQNYLGPRARTCGRRS